MSVRMAGSNDSFADGTVVDMETLRGMEDAPRGTPHTSDEIREIVSVAVKVSMGASDTPEACSSRAEAIVELYPLFAETYPKLVQVCCSCTTAEKARTVEKMLDMMLSRMEEIDVGKTTFEDACKDVGGSLKTIFSIQNEKE
jgi:hypothetical protein